LEHCPIIAFHNAAPEEQAMNFARRPRLQVLGFAVPASMLPGCFRDAQTQPRLPKWESPSAAPWRFIPAERDFNEEERRFVETAVERLIAANGAGPGGVEAGVVGFMDRQLAGPFGRAARGYMQGSWRDATDQQGYQPHDQSNELHSALEQGSIPLDLDGSGILFELFLQNTKEGLLADSMCGVNRDFAEWSMIGFPGSRYDDEPFMENDGEPDPFPPVSLLGRTGRAAR
jgi:gluconate 2-dehydrogenase gamma chain